MIERDPELLRAAAGAAGPGVPLDRLLRQPRAGQRDRRPRRPASCSSTATSPTSSSTPTSTASRCCSSPSTCCACKHIIVCGHYGCGGVRAAFDGAKLGLIDNWLRHVQDVREQHAPELDALATERARRPAVRAERDRAGAPRLPNDGRAGRVGARSAGHGPRLDLRSERRPAARRRLRRRAHRRHRRRISPSSVESIAGDVVPVADVIGGACCSARRSIRHSQSSSRCRRRGSCERVDGGSPWA